MAQDDRAVTGDDDRLPWLETADDTGEPRDASPVRVAVVVILGLLLLAAVVGGIYALQRSQSGAGLDGEGELIAAPKGPYKVRPDDPGGRSFDGEGDTAYAASQGKTSEGRVIVPSGRDATATATTAEQNAAAGTKGGKAGAGEAQLPAGAGLVQLGAFSDTAKATAEWQRLTTKYAALSGLDRKITTGSVEGRTVYRLAAVTKDTAAANQLCQTLKGQGASCLVVR